MLARVADSLYWTGRYIERSEHLARYLKVQYFSILDAPMSQNTDFVFKSILNMYGIKFDPELEVDEQEVLFEVGLSLTNNVSFFLLSLLPGRMPEVLGISFLRNCGR